MSDPAAAADLFAMLTGAGGGAGGGVLATLGLQKFLGSKTAPDPTILTRIEVKLDAMVESSRDANIILADIRGSLRGRNGSG
jgi:hypothetical protein